MSLSPPATAAPAGAKEGKWTQGAAPYLLLSLFCAILYLPGLDSLPPLDRDEARFIQATSQMLETGDYVNIRFQEEPRHKKPAGVHWLQVLSVKALTDPADRELWAYRAPSALGAWLAVLFTFAAGARLFDRRTALMGAVMLAGCVMVQMEAHQAKTDATLLGFTTMAMAALARVYGHARGHGPDPGVYWWPLFWVGAGAGVLIKGPITPVVVLLTILTLCAADRKLFPLARLRPAPGIVLAAAVAGPWFYLIQAQGASSVPGETFLITAIKTDLIPKLVSAQESHGAPPGYFAGLMIAFFFPASLYAWPALYRAVKAREETGVRFCLAWLIPAWAMFEIAPTKLPHYTLPLYPALALITAWALMRVVRLRDERFPPLIMAPLGVLWGVLALALSAAAVALALWFGTAPANLGAVLIGAGGLLLPLALYVQFQTLAHETAARNLIVAMSVFAAAVLGGVLPRIDAMWPSRAAAQIVETHAPHAQVAAAGFHEPSLVFLLGTETKLTDAKGAARHLLETPNGAAVIEIKQRLAFRNALGDRAADFREVGAVSGVNYSKGDPVNLRVYVRKAP